MALAEREISGTPATTIEPIRRRWTRDEYYKMVEVGILGEKERVELIRGEIEKMAPIGPDHSSTALDLYDLLNNLVAAGCCVMYERPIVMDDNTEPEPDLIVARGDRRVFRTRHPMVTEVAVVIETSKSSLLKDRTSKLYLYAEAKIPEYWIVNLLDNQVEVYTDVSTSSYDSIRIYRAGASIPLSFAPGKSVAVDDFLPA